MRPEVTPGSNPETPPANPAVTPPGNAPETQTVTFEEFDRLKREKDYVAGRLRTMERELETLKAKPPEPSENPKGSERLTQAEARIKELETVLSTKDGRIRDLSVKSSVTGEAVKRLREDAVDAFWAMEGHRFDEVEVGEQKKIGLKDAPYMNFDEYFGDLQKRAPFLFKSTRAPGTGVPGKDAPAGAAGGVSVEELERMSPAERDVEFRKDPKLRQRFAEERARGR